MRIAAGLAALTLVSACATAGAPIAPPPQSVAAAAPSQLFALLARAGHADAPTEAEVTRALGAPDISRRDGVGAALTYRFEACALLLLFSADERNAMRLREAHAGPRRNGSATPSLDQCVGQPRRT